MGRGSMVWDRLRQALLNRPGRHGSGAGSVIMSASMSFCSEADQPISTPSGHRIRSLGLTASSSTKRVLGQLPRLDDIRYRHRTPALDRGNHWGSWQA